MDTESGTSPLPRPHHELIALRVFEDGVFAPGLLLRLLHELDAAFFQLPVAGLDVIAGEGAVEEGADAVGAGG